ncbi:GNAT family N-acetyltransferase [Devosia epidermidihirudinis]|uniref:hypothetical protein n=1 Tax=Devosia epidermidihirudinis TaxID=1293439 RepID=UPI000A8160A2|nr:hypothetical protein [Devosia epidermidihirudinis]
MTDTVASSLAVEVTAPGKPSYRPARYSDLDLVRNRLAEVIAETPYYSATFKAYESARLSKQYLAALIDADPHHVMLFERDNKVVGFMISGPELGTLWLYWSYLFPEYRRASGVVWAMKTFINHWDNGRFHKIATYTKEGNDAAAVIMTRTGYKHIATLENHIFGEDYQLYERPLTKAVDGYDHGTSGGIKNKLLRRLKMAFAR